MSILLLLLCVFVMSSMLVVLDISFYCEMIYMYLSLEKKIMLSI